jgi:hypothetical protein
MAQPVRNSLRHKKTAPPTAAATTITTNTKFSNLTQTDKAPSLINREAKPTTTKKIQNISNSNLK